MTGRGECGEACGMKGYGGGGLRNDGELRGGE